MFETNRETTSAATSAAGTPQLAGMPGVFEFQDYRKFLGAWLVLCGVLTLALVALERCYARAPANEAHHQPAATVDPVTRAARLGAAQPRVQAVLTRLKFEAKQISDRTLRADALQILERPVFKVVAARAGAEKEIVAKLKAEKLLGDEVSTIFPTHGPMAFVATPGGGSTGHHRYPGGLAYHTAANLLAGLGFARSYHEVYGPQLNLDLIRAGAIWHDAGKTITLYWNADGTAVGEGKIAGTPAHHIWAVAEAIYRGYPASAVVVIASAHSSALPGNDLAALIKYLKAGAILAGKPFAAAGLNEEATALSAPAPLESYINHMADHDFVVAAPSQEAVAGFLGHLTGGNRWEEDRLMAEHGDLAIYERLITKGAESTARWLQK